jgi:hypothetical protein
MDPNKKHRCIQTVILKNRSTRKMIEVHDNYIQTGRLYQNLTNMYNVLCTMYCLHCNVYI